ncbi:MAG TPA: hypothetical protein VK395_02400 [Gemmataceae bacterium]|nr:hypothetical protein [Gemmataceae bacterium]
MIRSNLGQRLIGLLAFAGGLGLTGWVWHTALTEGEYYRKAAALPPLLAVFGLGLLLFPIDVEKLKAEHGVEKFESWHQMPLEWKVLLFVALAAALGNWYAIAQL